MTLTLRGTHNRISDNDCLFDTDIHVHEFHTVITVAGMVDIARQTVEFLYEENGGMPRDLHLPTIDDIKEELAKFTIERVRKGRFTGALPGYTAVLPTCDPL